MWLARMGAEDRWHCLSGQLHEKSHMGLVPSGGDNKVSTSEAGGRGCCCHWELGNFSLWQYNLIQIMSSTSLASSGFSQISPRKLMEFHSFLINALMLTADTFWGWILNFCCDLASALLGLSFAVWHFSVIWLKERRFTIRTLSESLILLTYVPS